MDGKSTGAIPSDVMVLGKPCMSPPIAGTVKSHKPAMSAEVGFKSHDYTNNSNQKSIEHDRGSYDGNSSMKKTFPTLNTFTPTKTTKYSSIIKRVVNSGENRARSSIVSK